MNRARHGARLIERGETGMDRVRWVMCTLVVLATGCTALTGADDLAVEAKSDSAGTTPPKKPRSAGNGTSGGGSSSSSSSSGGSSSGAGTDTTTPATLGVTCGTETCAGAKPKCCASPEADTCVAAEAECGVTQISLSCSDGKTCGAGTVCCLVTGPMKPYGECRAPSACLLPSAVLCSENAQCPNKQCNQPAFGLINLLVCAP